MHAITSGSNPIIKEVKALKTRKNREEKGLYFIEGIRFVEEAMDEDVSIEKLIISEGLWSRKSEGCEAKNKTVQGGNAPASRDLSDRIGQIMDCALKKIIPTYLLPDKLFSELSDTETPQGIMAVVRMAKVFPEEILQQGACLLLLDGLQDPGNLGTIIRTADAVGIEGILISKGSVDIYNPKVLRSTMGSIFHVPLAIGVDLQEMIPRLKDCGMRVLAAHLDGELAYYEADWKGKVAIIIGNEANGISPEVADLADVLVKIPMPGRAESLNASVAACLMMYEILRQNFVTNHS